VQISDLFLTSASFFLKKQLRAHSTVFFDMGSSFSRKALNGEGERYRYNAPTESVPGKKGDFPVFGVGVPPFVQHTENQWNNHVFIANTKR